MGASGMANKSPYRNIPAGSGTDTAKTEEDLTAQLDGVAVDFTISQPFVANSLELFYNGIKQRNPNEFTVESSTKIQTTFTPTAASTLTVAYYPT